jgi:hypothetical protein
VIDEPEYAETVADMPFVAVYLGDEPAPARDLTSTRDREVMMTIRVAACKGGVSGKGATASSDPLMVEIHSRLMANLTLGGVAYDIEEQGTRRQRDVLDKPVAYTEKDYLVRYRTTATSLET